MVTNHTGRVFVVIRGGKLANIDIPAYVDGTHTVIDCDDAENDPAAVWGTFDPVDQAYVRTACADLVAMYWPGELEGCG